MADTVDQRVADKLGRAIDGQIFRLNAERVELLAAAVRIADIEAELVGLSAEKARIDPRRPVRSPNVEEIRPSRQD